jgi:putative DNA methylase
MTPIKTPRKLIEVALPLDVINVAAAREKSIRHGHPSTLHLWWARRPLAAARAVIFAQMVNDPGYQQGGGFKYGMNKEKAAIERERLFKILEDLVQWESTTNEEVLGRARAEIQRSWRETCELNKDHPQAATLFDPDKLPAFHDPFAGGGALPLEAQRLGLESYASDLNPVAVLINKAMIEIPPKFAGLPPVNPGWRQQAADRRAMTTDWRGAKGLADDVRYYGQWMRDEAEKRIGHLYPQIAITAEMVEDPHNPRPDLKPYMGKKLTVIAWLWARTVKSPNPVFSHVDVPLASTFVLSSKVGKEAYVQPVVEGDRYRFLVKMGTPPENAAGGTTAGKRAAFICLLSKSPIDYKHIRAEGKAGGMGQRLMAIVAEGTRGRIYLSPTPKQIAIAESAKPEWSPEMDLPNNPRDFKTPNYGLTKFSDLFTPRQLLALTTFSDLAQEARAKVKTDALASGMADDGRGLNEGGTGATAYAEAVGVYLAFAVSKMTNIGSSVASWMSDRGAFRETFARQSIPMVWDFAEANTFADTGGSFLIAIDKGAMAIDAFPANSLAMAVQADAASQTISIGKVVSTDPPYYDNIGYADLSDFFYVWLRRALKPIFPDFFVTLAVPKAEELVATPYRHGSKEKAEAFFLGGMTRAMHRLAEQAHPAFPVTIYYAFKQAESDDADGTTNTGWVTFLGAVIEAGFAISGTWPMHTEGSGRMIAMGTNALASSIILVCRKRVADAPTASRREFIRELNAALPEALLDMTRGGVNSPVAPVDLSQAIIGPGMAIFSQYSAVLEADGTPMRVKTALQLINRFFAEDDFDHDTQFCLHWFEGQGWAEGKFGEADVLARAKGTSVGGLQTSGVVESGAGKLRLLRWTELRPDWAPETDTRVPVWEALHQLIRALNQDSESAAGSLLARMPARAESIRALAYHLYTLCERKGWAEEARAYNELIAAWPGIEQASTDTGIVGAQAQLDL